YTGSMKFYEVAPMRIVRANQATFTYSSSEKLAIGTLVRIPVGKQRLTGLVMKEVSKASYDTKEVATIIESTPLPVALVSLAEWLSTYYQTHPATVLQTLLPRGLTTTRRVQK